VLPIAYVLDNLAGGENCDGEPYDTMVAASEYIRELETENSALRKMTNGPGDSREYWWWDFYHDARRLKAERQDLLDALQASEGDEVGKKVVNLAIKNAELQRVNKGIRRQLTIHQEGAERRNKQLDALNLVYCDGGCEGGVRRQDGTSAKDVTLEVVTLAVENTNRLVNWWRAYQYRQNREHYGDLDTSDWPQVGFISARAFARWKRMAGVDKYHELEGIWLAERAKNGRLENEKNLLKAKLEEVQASYDKLKAWFA
jgi:hypothetical protein